MTERERYEQLLADEATHDLTAETREELDRISLQHPDWQDDTFELAAAALHLALQEPVELMPDDFRQRLRQRLNGA